MEDHNLDIPQNREVDCCSRLSSGTINLDHDMPFGQGDPIIQPRVIKITSIDYLYDVRNPRPLGHLVCVEILQNGRSSTSSMRYDAALQMEGGIEAMQAFNPEFILP